MACDMSRRLALFHEGHKGHKEARVHGYKRGPAQRVCGAGVFRPRRRPIVYHAPRAMYELWTHAPMPMCASGSVVRDVSASNKKARAL